MEMYSRQPPKNTVDVSTGYRVKMDSEESILPQDQPRQEGITKTFQVSVLVNDRRQRSPRDIV